MKRFSFWAAFVIIGTVGTLLHFCYDWSGENAIVGAFVPVNESIWEHLKLLFFPAALYAATENIIRKKVVYGAPAAAVGLFSGMAVIVTAYYTYSGIIGKNIDWINVLLFFIGVFTFLFVRRMFDKNRKSVSLTASVISAALIIAVAILFILWSFDPPKLGIFIPPES